MRRDANIAVVDQNVGILRFAQHLDEVASPCLTCPAAAGRRSAGSHTRGTGREAGRSVPLRGRPGCSRRRGSRSGLHTVAGSGSRSPYTCARPRPSAASGCSRQARSFRRQRRRGDCIARSHARPTAPAACRPARPESVAQSGPLPTSQSPSFKSIGLHGGFVSRSGRIIRGHPRTPAQTARLRSAVCSACRSSSRCRAGKYLCRSMRLDLPHLFQAVAADKSVVLLGVKEEGLAHAVWAEHR